MNRVAYLMVWIVCILASVHACGGNAQTDSTSGNTNWLKYCDTEADCGEGLSCWCNSCQETCLESVDCELAGFGSHCASPSEDPQCNNTPVGISFCVKSCDVSGDCQREDLTCSSSGTCVARASFDSDSGAVGATNAEPVGDPADSSAVQAWWSTGVPAAGAGAQDNDLDGAFALFDDRYGAFAAPACPPRAEQLTFTLKQEMYTLDPTQPGPNGKLVLYTDCGGSAVWLIEACDSTGEACVNVSHQLGPEEELFFTARAAVGDQDTWVAMLDSGDVGDSYWCQENGFWRAWVDFSFTKEAIQYDGQAQPGATAPLTVTMQAYADGQVCFGSDGPFPLRHCSEDPSVEVRWTCAATETTCDGELTGQSCGSFCNDHDTARVELASSCATTGGNSIVQRQIWSYEVLQINGAAGALTRAFYDEQSGELMGIWSRSDTGEEQCSGSVPADLLQGFPVEDEVDECIRAAQAGDAG